MGRKLLHTLGYNDQGIIVHVNDAVKGKSYSCPLCGERIIARNGGKSQRPHFAHFKKSEVKKAALAAEKEYQQCKADIKKKG